MDTKAILILQDGTIFHGKGAGFEGVCTGEICFNTGMTGYQEIFTDPSYNGQVMVTTNAHIGNYGVKDTETESESVQISALVCKNFSANPSRPLSDTKLSSYLKKNKVACIYGIDTREIVKIIRDKGSMNCIVSTSEADIEVLKEQLDQVPSMEGLELASKVSTPEAYELGDENSDIKIAVLDYGVKKNILRCMTERGAKVKVFPAKTDLATIKEYNPDGYFFSNGPGDPATMDYAIDLVKSVLEEDVPAFGICLGHQLIGLANGIDTYKMHNGHRGANHPVINLETGKSEITSQNHGFGVSPESVANNSDKIKVTHRNLNDDTIEGFEIIGKNVFSVQYHPESSPGPHDSRYLFDKFIQTVKDNK